MTLSGGRTAISELEELHVRLSAHFTELRSARNKHDDRLPIFALEHGLTAEELVLLKAGVREQLRLGRIPPTAWLPVVVYATEIGYSYTGDEYWQTFESETPGWAQYGDRGQIRDRFREFATRYGGAVPTGSWAGWFTIICWPITNAVLPTDLQRQLARLLFEFRGGLTVDLMTDPGGLGRKLAARAWQTTSRFQNFAQNTQLLGQVAAALLAGEDDESPYLTKSTLRRIVADLTAEREARQWLKEVHTRAAQLRLKGFSPRESNGRSPSAGPDRVPRVDPLVFLRRDAAGWAAWIELPDFSSLSEKLPNLHAELNQLRCRIAGVNGPLGRGSLLSSGLRRRFDRWPEPGKPLIELEKASPELTQLFISQCTLPGGPRWVFRCNDPSRAVLVRGTSVRPNQTYVIVSTEPLNSLGPIPDWVSLVPCVTEGTHSYDADVPARPSESDLDWLRAIGVEIVLDVDIRPVGPVPAAWDGAGLMEWIAGDEPVIALRSAIPVSLVGVNVDAEPQIFRWPEGASALFFSLSELAIGTHEVQVFLESSSARTAEGEFTAVVRNPQSHPSTGTLREAVVILATPAAPTLSELWSGQGTVEIAGPDGTELAITVTFRGGRGTGETLARQSFSRTLPITSADWTEAFNEEVQSSSKVLSVYDRSDECVVSFTHFDLGVGSLRCQREFSPLRWASGEDRQGPFLQLVDHTHGQIRVERRNFRTPGEVTLFSLDDDMTARWPEGGLAVAASGEIRATAILAPQVRTFDDFRRAGVDPQIRLGRRSTDSIMRGLHLADLWRAAPLPANVVAARSRMAVLRAIAVELAVLIIGPKWLRIERRFQSDNLPPSLEDFDRWVPLSTDEKVAPFSAAVGEQLGVYMGGGLRQNLRLSEFLLRLASDPGSLCSWPEEEVRNLTGRVLEYPNLLQFARIWVLSVDSRCLKERPLGGYGGFAWP